MARAWTSSWPFDRTTFERELVDHRLRISNQRVFQYCVCTCSTACSGVAPLM
jgi:hypothetical protein